MDIDKLKPPERGILPARFRLIDNVQDSTFVLWDMGDILHKKTPEPWLCHTYWDAASREKADKRLRFITGLLNNSRQPSEVIDFN